MEWTDIRLTVAKADADNAEAVATMIAEGGIYIEDYSDIEQQVAEIAHVDLIEQELLDKPRDTVIIHMYLEPGASPVETLALIQARMEAAGIAYTVETEGVEQEDWQNGWRKYYHPMDIGKRLAIVPSWQEYDTDRVKLVLDPGLAFGTGGHETTSLCMEALDERVTGGERVLDIGTGSGILAIAALKLGAAVAEGVDIDPVAVRTAGENAALNGVQDKLTVLVGDLSDKASGKYDIITANIVANAIISLAPAVPGLMAEGVVGMTEVIEVQVTQRQASPFVFGQSRRQQGLEALAIGNAGERVLLGESLQSGFQHATLTHMPQAPAQHARVEMLAYQPVTHTVGWSQRFMFKQQHRRQTATARRRLKSRDGQQHRTAVVIEQTADRLPTRRADEHGRAPHRSQTLAQQRCPRWLFGQ